MRYRTVKEVVEFLDGLSAEEVDDVVLEIRFSFYFDGRLVGLVTRNMYSNYIHISKLINKIYNKIYNYRVESFVIEDRGCSIRFKFMLGTPSSIQY